MSPDELSLLVVEDDDDDVLLLRDMLRQSSLQGVKLEHVPSLHAALQALTARTYGLVLLDLSLPDSTGLDTFIAVMSQAAATPVIVLSGLDDETVALAAVQAGAQDYLVKGDIDTGSLTRAVRYAIERSRAEQALRLSEQRYRQLLNAVPSYTYSVQFRHGVPVSTNHSPGCESVTGYTPQEYAANTGLWIGMVPPQDQPAVLEQVNWRPHSPDPPPLEHRIVHKDGSTRWVRSTIVRHLENDVLSHYEGLIEDITERKQYEEALRLARDQLEVRVLERTADLAKANEELLAAIKQIKEHDDAQTRFVSNVSHELRTPLSSMSYAIENLLRGVMGPLPETMRSYLVMLKDDCHRLTHTVNDILDLSRMDNRALAMHLTAVQFADLVNRAVETLRSSAEAKQHKLTVVDGAAPCFVACDPTRMERVVLNALQNAIKFTPAGGRIEVAVACLAGEPPLASLTITDNGIGIESRHLGRIAERFYRVGEHVDGMGLGLYISKEIVTQHGGRLEILSPPPGRNRGTAVQVLLPLADPPSILVVDEDEAMRQLVVCQLTRHGYRTACAARGEDGLATMRDQRPDLVVLDVNLPDMDGAEVLYRIKADQTLRAIPVVALGGSDVDSAKRSILAGFSVPLLSKPWSEDLLVRTVENALRRPAADQAETPLPMNSASPPP